MQRAAGRLSGSIPARAGEPVTIPPPPRRPTVYPRACGGTRRNEPSNPSHLGLSPRVRGNPYRFHACRYCAGSIPARAGEPPETDGAGLVCTVYPRACGGTSKPAGGLSESRGLSPRVRGNPSSIPSSRQSPGSIPARAGEPLTAGFTLRMKKVYPRACGGTETRFCPQRFQKGLSPRVRGNLRPAELQPAGLRSIPARAGEPPRPNASRWHGPVYPRACGGTPAEGPDHRTVAGLSPRVRGNPRPGGSGSELRRSIPARAGEPNDV